MTRFTGLLGDVLTGFTWWNLGTQLADVVFFFPMFKMAISGYEILVFISPVFILLLSYPWFKTFAFRHPVFFHFLSLLGYSAFYTGPELKVGILAVMEGFSMLSLFSRLLDPLPERRTRGVYGTILGLIILVIGRMAFHSLNPWWIMDAGHFCALFFGVVGGICLYIDLVSTPSPSSPSSAASPSSSEPSAAASASVTTSTTPTDVSDGKKYDAEIRENWLTVSLGFGALMFIVRWLASEHGIIARWTSVQPFPSGVLMVLSLATGLLLNESSLPGSTLWWLLGGCASVVFYYGPGVIGYCGGLLLITYATSLWHLYLQAMFQLQSLAGKTISVAIASQLLWVVGTVWVVAYNFVPLGNLSRERVYVILFASAFVVGYPFWVLPRLRSLSSAANEQHPKKTEQKTRHSSSSSSTSSRWLPSQKIVVVFLLALLLLGLLPVAIYRAQELAEPAEPSTQPKGTFTGMIWTIHFGYDNLGENNFHLVRDLINKEGRPEVIGLLETDLTRVFTGNRDLVEYLAAHLHYYSDYGPETRENTWGCALLSLYPIVRADHILMPSITGELACAIDATLDVDGTHVDVIVAHFGNFEDFIDRKLQSEYVRDLVGSKPENRPVIFLGYVVTEPWGENFKIITATGFQDSAPHYLDRWCQYIFFKNLRKLSFKNRSVGKISDTEFQWARFSLLDSPET